MSEPVTPDARSVSRENARSRERSTRTVQLASSTVLVLFFGFQLFLNLRDEAGSYVVVVLLCLAAMLIALGLLAVWVNRPGYVAKRLKSRFELGELMDRTRDPWLRGRLVWVEFAMALATTDGSASGDAPGAFLLEATDAERHVSMGRGPHREVGRAVVAARTLGGETRWAALLDAARLYRTVVEQ